MLLGLNLVRRAVRRPASGKRINIIIKTMGTITTAITTTHT